MRFVFHIRRKTRNKILVVVPVIIAFFFCLLSNIFISIFGVVIPASSAVSSSLSTTTAPYYNHYNSDGMMIQKKQKRKKLRLCTRDEIREGQWVPVQLDEPPYVPTHSKCYTRQDLADAVTNQSWNTYHWYPYNATSKWKIDTTITDPTTSDELRLCDYSRWSTELFCSLMNNKTIAFGGDSITLEQFASLAGLLGITGLGAHDQLTFTMDGVQYNQMKGISLPVCGGQSTIFYYRHRFLMYIDYFILNQSDPDILVLNRGSHYFKDDILLHGFPGDKRSITGIHSIINYTQEWQNQNWKCRQRTAHQGSKSPNCLVIWKTTTVGHPYCDKFTKPVTSKIEMEQYIASQAPIFGKKYNWEHFNHQNTLVVQMFRDHVQRQKQEQSSTETYNFDVLDTYDLGLLRPDSHVSSKDCLHNCNPGIQDEYNTMLLHLLRLHYEEQNRLKNDK